MLRLRCPCMATQTQHRAIRRSRLDRKSTRLNSSHTVISYAVFCFIKEDVPPDETRRDDLPQRVQLEFVVGDEHQLRLLRVGVDRGLRALAVVALRHLLARLVERDV